MGRERPRHPAPEAAPAPPTGSLTPHLSVSSLVRAPLIAEEIGATRLARDGAVVFQEQFSTLRDIERD